MILVGLRIVGQRCQLLFRIETTTPSQIMQSTKKASKQLNTPEVIGGAPTNCRRRRVTIKNQRRRAAP